MLLLEFRVTVVLTAISFRSALTFREAVVKGDKMIHLKINTHIKVQLNCSLSVIYCKCYFAFLVPVITITVIVMKPHDFMLEHAPEVERYAWVRSLPCTVNWVLGLVWSTWIQFLNPKAENSQF